MDFITFKSFISTEVLIIFYYIGALILPIGIWILVKWLIKKYLITHKAQPLPRLESILKLSDEQIG